MERTALMRAINSACVLIEREELCADQRDRLKQLCSRLESRQFIISVFGQFKRGKSTFINCVLGEDILPVGIVPVTSAVTRIKHGERGAEVFTDGGVLKVPLNGLGSYINELENPDNVKDVASVEISYPAGVLSSGMILVDTPGVGSMHRHNSEAAYAFVKESDAVIFMLSVDSPINEIECGFIAEVREFASKIYFAVNKTDTVSPSELDEYIAYCRKALSGIVGDNRLKIYPVIARNKGDKGVRGLMDDIMSDLKSYGDDLLSESAGAKSAYIIKEALGQVNLYLSALSMPVERLEETADELKVKLAALDVMAKESAHLMELRAEDAMEQVRKVFEQEKARISADITEKINAAYNRNPQLRSRRMEKKLRGTVESELTPGIAVLDAKGAAMLKEGYESEASLFGEKLTAMHSYLTGVIRDLFNVEYPFAAEKYLLSAANDFYIDVNRASASFMFDAGGMVHLLPDYQANKKILNRIIKASQQDVARNVTNMISNYSYRIRESNRSFRSDFTEKVEQLKKGFDTFIRRTLSERRSADEGQAARKAELNTLAGKLEKCLDEVKQPA